MKNVINFLRFVFVLVSLKSTAQDIQFSQFYAVPVYQNPAFAGSTYMHRFTMHQRLQWAKLDARYTSTLVGWDGYISKLRGGVGVYASHDIQGSGKIVTDEIAGQYSYELPVSEKFVVRAGAQLAMTMRAIDYSQFRYGQDYTDEGFQSNTYDQKGNDRFYFGDISSGGVLFSDRLWVGIASHHMNQPKQSFANNDKNRLPMKMSFTGGYKFTIRKSSAYYESVGRNIEHTLIPTFQYKMQGKSDQLDLGLYSQLDRLLLGVWYRGIAFKTYEGIQNNESAIFLAGIKYHNISFAYSYDLTVSTLSKSRTGGAHELNLTVYLQRKVSTPKFRRSLPCPDFIQ